MKEYYIVRDRVVRVVNRFRPLDLTYRPHSRNLGLLCVGETGEVWIATRNIAWRIGELPDGTDKDDRNAVVRWAKRELEDYYRNLMERFRFEPEDEQSDRVWYVKVIDKKEEVSQ